MAVREIPLVPSSPFIRQRAVLDGVNFEFTLSYVQRTDSWLFSLFDATGDPIVEGIKVSVDWPILRLVTDDRAPAGTLMFLDESGFGTAPGLADLGDRVRLLYNEAL